MKLYRLLEAGNGRCLLGRVMVAEHFFPRFFGLMGKRALEPNSGLYIPRCSSIHMFFMRFPIDAVYLRGGTVRRIVPELKPWRLSWCPGADSVLEAPAGWGRQAGVGEGTRVCLVPRHEECQ